MMMEASATLPKATRHGPKPIVCKGLYSQQVKYAIDHIKNNVDLQNESVAFLKPKGGQWFYEIKNN